MNSSHTFEIVAILGALLFLVAAMGSPVVGTIESDYLNEQADNDDLDSAADIEGNEPSQTKFDSAGDSIPSQEVNLPKEEESKPLDISTPSGKEESKPLEVSMPVVVRVRVEGETNTIFSDDVLLDGSVSIEATTGILYSLSSQTPMGALETASTIGGFEVVYSDQYIDTFDLFVTDVGGDGPKGFCGWFYRVNYVSPFYGGGFGWDVSGPALEEGDVILWYWGCSGDLPLIFDVNKVSIQLGEQVSVLVTFVDNYEMGWAVDFLEEGYFFYYLVE